jgi:ATP-binding cassette subfamily G (WHITE) protein 2 (SNQ2)
MSLEISLSNFFYDVLTADDRAEFMLGVIGAGATATLTIDWHNVWKKFPEAAVTMHEIQRIL